MVGVAMLAIQKPHPHEWQLAPDLHHASHICPAGGGQHMHQVHTITTRLMESELFSCCTTVTGMFARVFRDPLQNFGFPRCCALLLLEASLLSWCNLSVAF